MSFSVPLTPAKRTFYYRNNHGKVVCLSEEIAFEQHNKHKEFLGCSEDLKRTGYDQLEAIAKHFKENVSNPTSPRDLRKMRFQGGEWSVVGSQEQTAQQTQPSPNQFMEWAKNNKEVLKQLLKEDGNNQGEKTKVEGVSGKDEQTPQGSSS